MRPIPASSSATNLEAIEGAFGGDVDYAQLVKVYGAPPESMKGRYSPAECTGARKELIEGNPDMRHVSTKPHNENEPPFGNSACRARAREGFQ